MGFIKKRAQNIIILVTLSLFSSFLYPAAYAEENQESYDYVFENWEDGTTDFSDETSIENWYKYDKRASFSDPRVWWSKDTISVKDGVLDLAAERHCVPEDAEASDSSSTVATSEPCPEGYKTIYKAQRMQIQNIPSENIVISFRAKAVSDTPSDAFGSSIFLQTMTNSCNPTSNVDGLYSDISLLNLSGANPNSRGVGFTVGCTDGASKFFNLGSTKGESLWNDWSTFTFIFLDGGMYFLRDGEYINSTPISASSFGEAGQKLNDIGSTNWRLVFQNTVATSGTYAVDDQEAFSTQHLLIDDLSIRQRVIEEKVDPEVISYGTVDPETPTVSEEMRNALGSNPELYVVENNTFTFDDTSVIDNLISAKGSGVLNNNDPDKWVSFNFSDWTASSWKYWRPENASIHNGVLDLVIRRHCLADGESPSDANAQTDPCPSDKKTVYSAPRMYSNPIPAGNFRVEIRAKTINNGGLTTGKRSNLWLVNGQPFCRANTPTLYGEFDLTEIYSGRNNTQYTSTHLGCYGANNRPESVKSTLNVPDGFDDQWHTWTFELFDGKFAYFLDGQLIGNVEGKESFNEQTQADYDQIINQPWRIIVENTAEHAAWATPVNNDEVFLDQHFLIDYIQVSSDEDYARAAALKAETIDVSSQSPTVSAEMLERIGRTPDLTVSEITNDFNEDFLSDSLIIDKVGGITDAKKWVAYDFNSWKQRQTRWTPSNASIHDGVLDLLSRRHCIDEGEELTDENTSEEPCPEGKITRYSAPRLFSPIIPKGNFTLTVRAKTVKNGLHRGHRSNIWLQSLTNICRNNPGGIYGEFDLTEIYSDRSYLQHSTTHFGCPQVLTQERTNVPGGYDNVWHTYTLEVFDGYFAYFLDGKLIGRIYSKDSFSAHKEVQDKYYSILYQPWTLILENTPESESWASPIKDTDEYPEQHFLIDYVYLATEEQDLSHLDPKPEESSTPSTSESGKSVDDSGKSTDSQGTGEPAQPADPAQPVEPGNNNLKSIVKKLLGFTVGLGIVALIVAAIFENFPVPERFFI